VAVIKETARSKEMQPTIWKPPIELSKQEEQVMGRIRQAKLFVFLRTSRHELFDEPFQQELATLYRPTRRGHPPIAPAQLALATILQAYMGVSDDDVIEATLMDRRWQLVLNCLDTEQAPFSKRTLVAFRKPLIEAQMDRPAPVCRRLQFACLRSFPVTSTSSSGGCVIFRPAF
jgi:transposase-like protein DUF772